MFESKLRLLLGFFKFQGSKPICLTVVLKVNFKQGARKVPKMFLNSFLDDRQGVNSQNYLCKFILFFLTSRCFYRVFIHRKQVLYDLYITFYQYLFQKPLLLIVISRYIKSFLQFSNNSSHSLESSIHPSEVDLH